MSAKITQEEFVKRSRKKHRAKFDYSKSVYESQYENVSIGCKKHGQFTQTPKSHWSGQGCPLCAGRGWTKDVFLSECVRVHGTKFDYSRIKFLNKTTKVLIGCKLHGDFSQTPQKHIERAQGCPTCAKSAQSLTYEDFVKRSKELHKNKYQYLRTTIYENKRSIVDIRCKQHGLFKQTAANHLFQKAGCPKCVVRVSKIERKVFKWLSKFTPVESSNRAILAPQELDIFCPKHNLAVEVNGTYWHSELFKDSKYHYTKALACYKKGIRLLQFWDHELINQRELCQSMLLNQLELNTNRVYARKCIVAEIDAKQAKAFFSQNHLQSQCSASVYLGLIHEDILIACMSFGAARFNKAYDYELIRFACLQNTSVVGGASRLFKAFLRTHKVKSLVSYADLRISAGGVYKQLGFKLKNVSAPNYVWTKGASTLTRYQCQKHKLKKVLGDAFEPDQSERVNMTNNGYVRVYDAGNLVYVYNPAE